MARHIPALVEGSVLTWARETAGYSVQEVAEHLRKDPEAIEAWESDAARPLMGQLRKLADKYKRSISDFYLPVPPDKRPLPHDFRRSPGEVAGHYSPALRRQLRFARERQDTTKYLKEDMGDPLLAFRHRAATKQSPEDVGKRIRDILGITLEQQLRWRGSYAAQRAWRSKIEAQGVLVFQFENVEVNEAWGFSIVEPVYPVIGVNKKLAPNGRTFTILHEFVHLLLGKGGICDIDDYTPRRPADLAIEVFCNHAAAAALMPEREFRANAIVSSHGHAATDWSDHEIKEIASGFCVSREATVRRLLTFELTTPEFYKERRAAYHAQFVAQKAQERERNKDRPFGGQSGAQRAVSDFGGNFVRAVLGSLGEQRITLADAAHYLQVRAPAVQKVQELAFRG